MHLVLKTLILVTNNYTVQNALGTMVAGLQFLRGSGSGGSIELSGERAAFELVRLLDKPSYCIFDIGSNRGQYLNLISNELSTQELTIHCFEPGKHTFDLLQVNIPKVDNHKVLLNNLAIGKNEGESTLWYNAPGSSLSSLTKRRLDHYDLPFDNSETVHVDTVDSYCNSLGIGQIDLLKIDIEGHELDALEGAIQMFEKRAISIVTFEFGGCNIDTRTYFQDFYYFFTKNKMKILRITPSGYLYPINSYNEALEQFKTTNFIAMQDN